MEDKIRLSKCSRHLIQEPGLVHYDYNLDNTMRKGDIPVVWLVPKNMEDFEIKEDNNKMPGMWINREYLEKASFFHILKTRQEIENSIDFEFAQVTYPPDFKAKENKKYFAISGISTSLKLDQLYMIPTNGNTKTTDSHKVHATRCKVIKVNISKEEVLQYMYDNNLEYLFIIDTQFYGDDAIYDNKYYQPKQELLSNNEVNIIEAKEVSDNKLIIEEDLEAELFDNENKKQNIRAGINCKTGELYVIESARIRISLGEHIEKEFNYAENLDTNNPFYPIGAKCYELLAEGMNMTAIHHRLQNTGDIPKDKVDDYTYRLLRLYFLHSSEYYSQHTAEFKSLVNISTKEDIAPKHLPGIHFLLNLEKFLETAEEYIADYDAEKQAYKISTDNLLEELRTTDIKNEPKFNSVAVDLKNTRNREFNLDRKYVNLKEARRVPELRNEFKKIIETLKAP